MKFIKTSFRYLAFLLALSFVIWIIFYSLSLLGAALVPWYFNLSKFWMFVVPVFFAGLAWSILSFLITLVMNFVARIPSNKKVGYYSVMTVAGLNALFVIFYTWTLPVEYSAPEILVTIVANVVILGLTFSIIGGAFRVWEEEEKSL